MEQGKYASMSVTAIIQARVGSTRLPGKVMYPLNGTPALDHVVTRVSKAESVSNVVVATSNESQDDVIADYGSKFGASIVRGSESNVLSRYKKSIKDFEPETVLRVTGDCPLISPKFIDTCVNEIHSKGAEYVAASQNRTFPRGLTCEAFTAESFSRMSNHANEPRHLEHVTPYYREHPNEFDLRNIESTDVYDEPRLQDRTDLRLTLDEPTDYRLLETVYREVDYKEILDIGDAIRYIDRNRLQEINEHVAQKTL